VLSVGAFYLLEIAGSCAFFSNKSYYYVECNDKEKVQKYGIRIALLGKSLEILTYPTST
jgi:hypothetical protein